MNLSFKVNKPADFIFEYLTDIKKYVSVHPVITNIERLEGNNYLVFETLNFWFIPISFTYPASIIGNDNKSIIMVATIMKITTIEITITLTPEGDFCTVEESLLFKSLLPVKPIMARIFKKQHTQIFKNISSITSN